MPAPADNPSLRCVIWHPPGVPLPADLLNSLSRRVRRMAVCADPYSAMAEVCAGERNSETARPNPGAAPGDVLLLVEPELLPDLPELLVEIRTFAPSVACWKFQQRANPRLSAVVESDVTTWMARGAAADAGVDRSLNASRTTSNQQRDLSSTSSPLTPARTNTPRRAPAANPAALNKPGVPQRPPALRLTSQTDSSAAPMHETARPRTPEVVVRPPPPIRAKPSLILRGEPLPERPPATQQPASLEGTPPKSSTTPRPMLTAEELRMLLGEDPIDGAGPKAANGRHPPSGKPGDGKGGGP